MIKYLKKYWLWCLLAPIFMLGEIAMDLIQPDMMADIVDNGVLKSDMSVIINTGVRMVILVLFGAFCGIMSGVFANFAAQRFGNDLRKDLFAKIMKLSFQQIDEVSTGSLVTRLTNDVSQVQMMVMMSVRSVIRCSVMFAGGVFMLYRQSAEFAFIAACGLPFIVFVVTFFMKKASSMFSVVQKKLDGINNVMQEGIAGARVVKAYVKEDYELGRFDKANDELSDVNLRVQSLLAFMHPCMNIILNMCVVGIIAAGGNLVKAGSNVTPGEIMAAITYMAMILHGIMFMANIFQTFTRAGASAKRISEILDSPDIIRDDEAGSVSERTGEIEFKNVSFAYPNSSGEAIIDNISLKINSGETFGIIGATGSGKSSLISLILRFYEATDGEVLVDGVNVKKYKLKELRDRIAVVLQKAEIYSRPIEANIRWGRSNAEDIEVKNAAVSAQADDFICDTKYGYYTHVTESGHSLSGGQKQRLMIARALLKKAKILILDDSTSALDIKTESKLYNAIRNGASDVTKIIIAQRISSIKDADRIAVLDNGKIVACGTHEELLAKSDIYQEIYKLQMEGGAGENEKTEG